jgi:hypothetical protein
MLDAAFQFLRPFGAWAKIIGILPNGDGSAFAFVELQAEGFLEGVDPLSFRVRVT